MRTRIGSLTALLGLLFAAQAAVAADAVDTGQALWQPQEIMFYYMGFNTAYQCDALADKIERLLRQVGVDKSVRASSSSCPGDRPSRNVSVRITLLAPVEANEQNRQAIAANEKNAALLQRLRIKRADTDEFPAQWKTVTLSDQRPADLGAGDCELLEQLRDRVFAKLSVKVVKDDVHCTPNQLNIVPPRLTVSALIPTVASVREESRGT